MGKKPDRPPRPILNKSYNIVCTTVTIDPGDHVLVATNEAVDTDTARDIMQGMRERFPETDFTFVSGVTLMKVPARVGKAYKEAQEAGEL